VSCPILYRYFGNKIPEILSFNRPLSKNVDEKVHFLGPKKEATFQILQFYNG
jgi:hypothetical protein